jgi:hypothetical protein
MRVFRFFLLLLFVAGAIHGQNNSGKSGNDSFSVESYYKSNGATQTSLLLYTR